MSCSGCGDTPPLTTSLIRLATLLDVASGQCDAVHRRSRDAGALDERELVESLEWISVVIDELTVHLHMAKDAGDSALGLARELARSTVT